MIPVFISFFDANVQRRGDDNLKLLKKNSTGTDNPIPNSLACTSHDVR
jgi:hypothetical protein